MKTSLTNENYHMQTAGFSKQYAFSNDGFIVINWTHSFMVCDSAVDRFRIGNGIIQLAEFRWGREYNAPSFNGLIFWNVHSHFCQTSYSAIKSIVGQDLSGDDFNQWSSLTYICFWKWMFLGCCCQGKLDNLPHALVPHPGIICFNSLFFS